jgi:hypothetical protein
MQRPRVTKDSNQCILSPHQEAELIKYIKELTERRLPPTRSMIRNFASKLAAKDVSESWVTRFINRNKNELTSQWAPAMDSVRHNADSVVKYSLYFDLLQHKISEYNIQPSETYNMDEKGFAIGVIGRSKRVFSKDAYERKRVSSAL